MNCIFWITHLPLEKCWTFPLYSLCLLPFLSLVISSHFLLCWISSSDLSFQLMCFSDLLIWILSFNFSYQSFYFQKFFLKIYLGMFQSLGDIINLLFTSLNHNVGSYLIFSSHHSNTWLFCLMLILLIDCLVLILLCPAWHHVTLYVLALTVSSHFLKLDLEEYFKVWVAGP